jgi:hypothetical protein
MSPQSRSLIALRLLQLTGVVALAAAAGCGNSSPAGAGTGHGGSSAGGATAATGTGGNNGVGTGGTTTTTGGAGRNGSGTGGMTATGTGGTTTVGAGGRSGGSPGTAGTNGNAGTNGAAGANSYGGQGGASSGGCDPNGPQCNNCIDDDGDGFIDYADPECVGPLDNDESSFGTGIPGDNIDPCKQDCFFDGNSGMGDDGCEWQLKCDPLSTEAKCPYDASYAASHTMECSASASQSQHCIDFCRRLVPNGCDCFGCCAIPGGPTIRLASTCTAKDFNDPTKCPPCTQVTQCSNPCGHCEICIGKPTLPPDCAATPDGGVPGDAGADSGTPPPPPPQCDSDFPISCGPGGSVPADGCPTGLSCLTGCCNPIP